MRHFRPCFGGSLIYHDAVFRIRTTEKTVFLTFDDGPHPASTPELLSLLEMLSIKATFFCNGARAEEYPDLINEIRNRGHKIGNHGYSHLNGWRTHLREYCEDIEKASSFTSSEIFRPPYGKILPAQYHRLKRTYRIIFWDIMAYDFDTTFSPESSLRILNKKLRPGSVVILHDSPGSSWKSLLRPFILASLDSGYNFSVIS